MTDNQGKRVGKIRFDVDELYNTVNHWFDRASGPVKGAYRDVLKQIEYLTKKALEEDKKLEPEDIDAHENVGRNGVVRIATANGKTIVELDGKTMAAGVIMVSFEHNCINGELKNPELKLVIDCEHFRFEPDGYFDKAIAYLSDER